jgi:hypothetical protein
MSASLVHKVINQIMSCDNAMFASEMFGGGRVPLDHSRHYSLVFANTRF